MPEALGPGAPGKFALAAWGGDAAPASAPASRGEQTGEEDAPSPTARLPGPARGVSPGALDRGRGVRSCRRRREGKRPRRGPLASPRGCLAPGGRWRQAGRRGRPGAQTFPRRLRRRNHPREGRGVQSSAAPPDGAPGRRTHGPAGRNWGTRLPPRSSEPRAENAPPGPRQPPGSEARRAGRFLQGGRGLRLETGGGGASGSLWRLEAGRHGADAAPRAPGRGGKRRAAGRSARTRGGSRAGLPGPEASRGGWANGWLWERRCGPGGRPTLPGRRRPGAEAAALQCHPRAREPPRRSRDRGSQAVFRGPDSPKAWSRLSPG